MKTKQHNTTTTMTITEKQTQAMTRLQSSGWTLDETTIHHLIGEKAIGIKATGQSGMVMWFCIEIDGYTHS